jgi:hypothetical protein
MRTSELHLRLKEENDFCFFSIQHHCIYSSLVFVKNRTPGEILIDYYYLFYNSKTSKQPIQNTVYNFQLNIYTETSL